MGTNKKKFSFRPFKQIRPKQWMNVDNLKDNAIVIKKLIESYVPDKNSSMHASNQEKNFDELLKKYNLTEKDLAKRIADGKKILYFCSIIGATMFLYGIYLLTKSHILAGLITFILTLNMAAYAIRESFTIYRIKQRSLVVTLTDWFKNIFNKG